jgi:hypothetical protein
VGRVFGAIAGPGGYAGRLVVLVCGFAVGYCRVWLMLECLLSRFRGALEQAIFYRVEVDEEGKTS